MPIKRVKVLAVKIVALSEGKLKRGIGLLLCLAVVFSAGSAVSTVRAAETAPVFLDAQGTCPLHPNSGYTDVCMHTKFGNAVAGTFTTRYTSWGIAYAFNCGQRARDFYAVVDLISLDGIVPPSGFWRHARRGKGYFMEGDKALVNIDTVPSQWRTLQSIVIKTACTWHVLAVDGDGSVVKRYVPPEPSFSPPGVTGNGNVQGL